MVSAVDSSVDLSVKVGPLELRNPVLSASGTFGYGLEFASLTRLERFGGLVTKGLSLQTAARQPCTKNLRDARWNAQLHRLAKHRHRGVSE